jgi:pyruvate dehydrogenase E1 component alpha subunit
MSAAHQTNQPSTQDNFSRDLHRAMLRIRMIEEEIAARYSEQEMRCPVHLSIGQEATAVGACAALRATDQIISSHRSHGHYLAKGGSLKAMLAEIYGRTDGCCGGRGGSMHLFDDAAGIIASIPIVGSFLPLGVGAAMSYRYAKQDRVCIAFLGDGASEEGVFHESANFAALKKLPVIFFLENNQYSCYTGLGDRQPDRPLVDLARAYAMASEHVDGNDVLAVYEATSRATGRARSGAGPTLIVADTYRWREHCGPNYDNDIGYRSMAEFESWQQRCPVTTFATRLKRNGVLSDAAEKAVIAEIATEVTEAFAFAKASPFPDPSTVTEHVYA